MNIDDKKVRLTELATAKFKEFKLEGWYLFFTNHHCGSLGMCYYEQKKIRISNIWVDALDIEESEDTLLHEIAHAITPIECAHRNHGGHGDEWYRNCLLVGMKNPQVYHISNKEQKAEYLKKINTYMGECPSCGYKTPQRIRRINGSCPKCSNGTYNAKYKLVWQTILKENINLKNHIMEVDELVLKKVEETPIIGEAQTKNEVGETSVDGVQIKNDEGTATEAEEPIKTTRFRQDLGDLTGLKESIKEIGQIHPIVIDSKGTLIAGARRLQVCIELGIQPVYRTVDFTNPEKAEIDENTQRKDFTASEIFEINKYYNEKLSKQGNRNDINLSTNDTEVKKQPRDIVADVTGVGTATLSKINKIYNSGDKELMKKVDTKEISIDKGYTAVLKKENKSNGNAGVKKNKSIPPVIEPIEQPLPTGDNNEPEAPKGKFVPVLNEHSLENRVVKFKTNLINLQNQRREIGKEIIALEKMKEKHTSANKLDEDAKQLVDLLSKSDKIIGAIEKAGLVFGLELGFDSTYKKIVAENYKGKITL